MIDQSAVPRLARSAALRYFAEVSERGSFRAASETLRIAASAINRQISNLEADIGVPLFERGRGRSGLRLTEAGRILKFRLRAALNELQIANDEIIALQGLQRGHVTLGINEVLAEEFLPGVLKEFHALRPNITYRIVVDNTRSLLDKLREGEIDFAVGYNFPPNEGLVFRTVVPIKMYVIVAKDHPLARRGSASLSDLSDLDIILPDRTFLLQQMIEFALRSAKVQTRRTVETNSLALIAALVENGVGASLVTGRIEFSDTNSRVTHIEVQDKRLPESMLTCCTLPGRSLSAAAEALISSMISELQSPKFSA